MAVIGTKKSIVWDSSVFGLAFVGCLFMLYNQARASVEPSLLRQVQHLLDDDESQNVAAVEGVLAAIPPPMASAAPSAPSAAMASAVTAMAQDPGRSYDVLLNLILSEVGSHNQAARDIETRLNAQFGSLALHMDRQDAAVARIASHVEAHNDWTNNWIGILIAAVLGLDKVPAVKRHFINGERRQQH